MSLYVDKFELDNQEILIRDSELTEKVNTLFDRKYVFIGDSYLQGWTDDQGTIENYGTMFKNKYNLVDNVSYFHNELGGTGFGAEYNNKNFKVLLQDLAETMTADQKDSITDIVVLGGRNDANTGVSDMMISSGTASLIEYAKANFPKANIYVGVVGWSKDSTIVNYMGGKVLRLVTGVIKNYTNAYYLNNIEITLVNKTLIDTVGNHPNLEGQKALCGNLIQCLNNGYCEIYYGAYATMTPDTNVSIPNGNLLENLHNNIMSLIFFGLQFSFSTNFTFNRSWVKLCDLSDDMLFGNIYKSSFTIHTILQLSNNSYTTREMAYKIDNCALYARLFNINSAGDNYETLSVKQLQLDDVTHHIGTYTQY